MYQCRRLQSVIGSLSSEVTRRKAPKISINLRNQLRLGISISSRSAAKKFSYLIRTGLRRHSVPSLWGMRIWRGSTCLAAPRRATEYTPSSRLGRTQSSS
jgi:hypothetical protein